MDFTEPYLRTILGFLGMTDVQTLRANGVKLSDNREAAIATGLASIPSALAE